MMTLVLAAHMLVVFVYFMLCGADFRYRFLGFCGVISCINSINLEFS